MEETIYQIKIELLNFEPKIWRSVLVNSDTTLYGLHCLIQTTMGWENDHLYQFKDKKRSYSDDDEDIDDISLPDVLPKIKSKIIYEYDFGDGWEHNIIVEKILPLQNEGNEYPVCIKGEMCCPPEDCGGTWGYAQKLEILKNPNDSNYAGIKMWMGDFDPNFFNIKDVNLRLKEIFED